MSSVGPSLPPELLAARKRKHEARTEEKSLLQEPHDSTVENTTAQESQEACNKSLKDDDSEGLVSGSCNTGRSTTNDDKDKSDRAHKEGEEEEEEEDDDDDDDIGPVLPDASATANNVYGRRRISQDTVGKLPQPKAQTKRPEWMLCPPSASDWTKQIDTTNLRSRNFATSRPGRPVKTVDEDTGTGDSWTTIPGQSAVHRQNEASSGPSEKEQKEKRQHQHDDAQRRKVAEFDATSGRVSSLYDQHNQKRQRTGEAVEDASSRPFDREKDIGRNSSLQKTRQMASNSKNLSSMFDSGKFL